MKRETMKVRDNLTLIRFSFEGSSILKIESFDFFFPLEILYRSKESFIDTYDDKWGRSSIDGQMAISADKRNLTDDLRFEEPSPKSLKLKAFFASIDKDNRLPLRPPEDLIPFYPLVLAIRLKAFSWIIHHDTNVVSLNEIFLHNFYSQKLQHYASHAFLKQFTVYRKSSNVLIYMNVELLFWLNLYVIYFYCACV